MPPQSHCIMIEVMRFRALPLGVEARPGAQQRRFQDGRPVESINLGIAALGQRSP